MLHLVVVEEALRRLLGVQVTVLQSSAVEVPTCFSNVNNVIITTIALILVTNVVFVTHCPSTWTDWALRFVALTVT